MNGLIRVGHFEPCVIEMGPGKRACLWVRGCSINCHGCSTPELIPSEPPNATSIDTVTQWIDQALIDHHIEGVSFSGGEPFEQTEALTIVARHVRTLGLSVISWSGYTLKHLQSPRAPEGSKELLAKLDVLVDGPFIESRFVSGLPLRGSDNQQIHLLTTRYSERDFAESKAQIRVNPDGSMRIIGVTDYKAIEAMMQLMGLRAN